MDKVGERTRAQAGRRQLTMGQPVALRHEHVLKAARDIGLLGTKGHQMGGRFPEALVEEAKRVTGLQSDTDLLTYALAKVALEDNFGEQLVAMKGTIPKGSIIVD